MVLLHPWGLRRNPWQKRLNESQISVNNLKKVSNFEKKQMFNMDDMEEQNTTALKISIKNLDKHMEIINKHLKNCWYSIACSLWLIINKNQRCRLKAKAIRNRRSHHWETNPRFSNGQSRWRTHRDPSRQWRGKNSKNNDLCSCWRNLWRLRTASARRDWQTRWKLTSKPSVTQDPRSLTQAVVRRQTSKVVLDSQR